MSKKTLKLGLEIDSLNEQVVNLEELLFEKDEEIAKLCQEIEENELDKLNTICELESEIDELHAKNSQLEAEIEELKHIIEKQAFSIDLLEQDIEELKQNPYEV